MMQTNYNQQFPDDSHGLGFELDQPWYMGGLAGPVTAGHTGFTGTSLVIDPESRSFAILLTNRVHPTRNWGSINNGPSSRRRRRWRRPWPCRPPGGGKSWFTGRATVRPHADDAALAAPRHGSGVFRRLRRHRGHRSAWCLRPAPTVAPPGPRSR